MGLSKKLGGTTQKMGLPASPVVPYKWSNQTYTVAEILKKFKLPCVVQCATDDSCTVVWSDFLFDLKQPLLLYSKRSVQKVHAVSLKQTNDVIEEIGPPLAIPADYEGWFGAAPKGISKAKRHFRIESIVNSTAPRFLVTTKCPAFTTRHGCDGDLQYIPHDVLPGEILRRVCVLDSDPHDPDCPDLVKRHGPCLECLDEKDEDVVIPLSYATLSYEVGDTYPDEESRVFQLSSVVEAGNTKLPRILTLIHGDPPLLDYAFTGMIRCYSVFGEETLLAATLEDPGSRCLELITDSCVKFRLGLNEAAVKKTCEYTSAFQMCENFGAKFVTKIKVAFTLKPEVSDTGAVDVSTSESTSDMQDVEASSEFDIKWGSHKKAKLLLMSNLPLPDAVRQIRAAAEPAMDTAVPIEADSLSDDQSPFNTLAGQPEISQHRDFTEKEIVKLMLKKGMMESTAIVSEVSMEQEFSEASGELEDDEAAVKLGGVDSGSLHGNRVTDNPLFYFFQRHPEHNPWKPAEPTNNDPTESEDECPSDDCQEENVNFQKDHANPLGYLFTQRPVTTSTHSEATHPLSYLFEPGSNENIDRELRIKEAAEKTNGSASTDIQTCGSSEEHRDELNHYNKVVYRTAREYSDDDCVDDDDDDDNADDDDDDDDDEDDDAVEEDDHSSESDDSSEIIEPSGISKEHYSEEGIHLSNTTNFIDNRYLQTRTSNDTETSIRKLNGSEARDVNCSPSLDRLHKLSTSTNHKLNSGHISSGVGVPNEETEAVHDLLTLVDMETSKDSSNNILENSKCPQNRNGGLGEDTQRMNVDSDTIQRVNTLLEEVSDIVTTSSDRILDSNKDWRNINPNNIVSINAAIKSKIYSKPVGKIKDDTANVAGVSSNLGTLYSGSVNNENITRPPKAGFDEFRLKHGDLKSKSHDRFNSELNMSDTETSPGISRSSNMRDDVPQINPERINQSKSWKLHKSKSRHTSLSSIFSVIRRQKTNIDLSKTNGHPEKQAGHKYSETDDRENESTSPTTSDSDKKYPFPYKSQRVLSLARANVSSFQTNDRLNSSVDSGSSNRSSASLDNSLNHGDRAVHKLVVIGDYDLIVEDQFHNGSGRNNDAIRGQQYTGHSYDPDLEESNAAGNTENEFTAQGQYVVSNSGRFRSNKLTCPRTNVLQIENEDEFLHEDYV